MKNYEAVQQWAATLNADKAYSEISKLREKYPWLKCDESFELIAKMYTDLPKIANIIKHQEKQNAIHRMFVDVNKMADAAIIHAVAEKAGIQL
jgi:hypothetical protein